MQDDLDSIPWNTLTHAYGTAEDVPALLRALKTAPPDKTGEDSPLWQLFGNIWHQGTVYEATAYAVPFLLELAADPLTPDRAGILLLLASIAQGHSYRDVRGNTSDEPNFEQKKSLELQWAADARIAVAAGFPLFFAMAQEPGEVHLAALRVLAQLPQYAQAVATLLRGFLESNTIPLHRAGLLLLLGQTGDRSPSTMSLLLDTLKSENELERRAATLSIARLRPQSLAPIARDAIIHAVTIDNLNESFGGLPWDVAAEIDLDALFKCLDPPAQSEAVDKLIALIESGHGSHSNVANLLGMLFPFAARPSPPLTPRDLSSIQLRAARALANAIEKGPRIFFGSFPQWRLPDTRRAWRDLANGRERPPIDMTLPLLADPADARRPLRAGTLRPGRRILHRHFGLGTVREARAGKYDTTLKVDFDEEGEKTLGLRSDR